MKKHYALYNKSFNCLEHLEELHFHTNKDYVIFKLNNNNGEIWITTDIDVAKDVKNGCIKKIADGSKKIPYNPYKKEDLEIIELDSFQRLVLPLPSLKFSFENKKGCIAI